MKHPNVHVHIYKVQCLCVSHFYELLSQKHISSVQVVYSISVCGNRGRMGHWLAAFLDPPVRMQAVGVEVMMSNLTSVVSGVPQETALGTLP
jgi:hypothetical protein